MSVTDAGMPSRKGWVQVMPSIGTTMERGRDMPLSQTVPPVPPPKPKVYPTQPPPLPPRPQTSPGQGLGISAPQMEAGSDSALHRDALRSRREDPFNIPCSDFFFDSEKVLSLNSENFTTFLTRKDATLVMFYSDQNPESKEFQKTFSEAASNTKRENHAFAGVDCVANPKLCKRNGVCKLPSVRLYSKTYCIGEIKCISNISVDLMRQYVEMAPVTDESRMVACCPVNN